MTSLVKDNKQEGNWTYWIFQQLGWKIQGGIYRAIDLVWLIPVRLYRIFRHFGTLIGWKWESYDNGDLLPDNKNPLHRAWAWLITLGIYILELLGIGEIYEFFSDIFKYNSRPLTSREIELAKDIYGNQINYRRVRIDEYAYLGPKQQRFCYVSFNLINSWSKMSDATFIHELIHVWQYQKMGAIYMAKAVLAQHSQAGYNYGGVKALRQAINKGKHLRDFNLEQQGDIVADYFRIKNGMRPEWGDGRGGDLEVYRKVMRGISNIQ